MMKIKIFDTTLRDGSQGLGISFSVEDKIKIIKALDELNIDFIECGWPGANPKDKIVFEKLKKIKLKHSKIVAFGSTRHKSKKAHEDENLNEIINSKTEYACIFGKSWHFHVKHALHTTLEENLRMIKESISYLRRKGVKVIYDAEHFFDGFKVNKNYALETIEAASKAGSINITLCDTNGGTLPHEISEIVKEVRRRFPKVSFGIHAHNDTDCAVSNSIAAVLEGCELVQGTINGLGERCGNANLCSVIPNLQIKLGYECIPPEKLTSLTEISRYVDEVANLIPNDKQPYVGQAAFSHKGGVHISAVIKHPKTYEHIDPSIVGNKRRILISELSGKGSVAEKIKEMNLNFIKDEKKIRKLVEYIKKLEYKGYQYEDADASFALLARKKFKKYKPFFELKGFRVIVEKDPKARKIYSEATIKLEVNGKEEYMVAEGDGPVNALDNALRKALERIYPNLKTMSLSDYKVRVINAEAGTAAKVRVFIESKDKTDSWGTVGVSENIIEASWQALADAIEYKLLKETTD